MRKSEEVLAGQAFFSNIVLLGGLGGLFLGVFIGNQDFLNITIVLQVLLIQNIVSSTLWHCLACADASQYLLAKIKSIIGNCFGTSFTGSL